MLTGRGDTKSLIDAPGWVDDEVRKRFVEGPNRLIEVLEDKERVDRRQSTEYTFGTEAQHCRNGEWGKWVHSEDDSTKDGTDLGVILWVIATESLPKNRSVK